MSITYDIPGDLRVLSRRLVSEPSQHQIIFKSVPGFLAYQEAPLFKKAVDEMREAFEKEQALHPYLDIEHIKRIRKSLVCIDNLPSQQAALALGAALLQKGFDLG